MATVPVHAIQLVIVLTRLHFRHKADLFLHSNTLSGTVPTTLGNLVVAEKIALYLNELVGSVPEEMCALTDAQVIVTCKGIGGLECDCCGDCTDI